MIPLTKEAAVAIQGVLAAVIDNAKAGIEAEKSASDKTVDEAQVAAVKDACTKQAEYMLEKGVITKEGFDKTVEGLSNPVTAMRYVKKAMDLMFEARDKVSGTEKDAADNSDERRPVGKASGKSHGHVQKTGAEKLAEADTAFEQAMGVN